MSSRRSSRSSRQSGSSRISDDQISDLVTKLQHLIPELRRRRSDKHMDLESSNEFEPCQHLKYYKRLATTSGTYTERLMISVTVCPNSWLQRTTTVPRQPSLGACLIIKILTN
ncbi:hypothetical protein HID58_081648 [Brassica napus]|uniref:BHLH domain-containing protein n=1 Tax=Brassica napus TaxID=3708 RepID=A0ABQ7Y8D6_BRANA|nr:hypothetical protein HID58_081648 [Brassica napus]